MHKLLSKAKNDESQSQEASRAIGMVLAASFANNEEKQLLAVLQLSWHAIVHVSSFLTNQYGVQSETLSNF